jgi:hypothetical protein
MSESAPRVRRILLVLWRGLARAIVVAAGVIGTLGRAFGGASAAAEPTRDERDLHRP